MATEESQVTVAQSAPEPQTAREGERIYVASQWQLMWWRFRKHKAAILATGLLAILYFVALFCEVLAPYDPNKYDVRFTYAPPMPLRFVDHGQLPPSPLRLWAHPGARPPHHGHGLHHRL